MSTPSVNPPTFRYPFEEEIKGLPEGIQRAHRYAFNGLLDVNQAVAALKSQITDLQNSSTSSSGSSATGSSTTIISSTGITAAQATLIALNTIQVTLGGTNEETGTSYTIQNSDYAKIIVINNTSAVAVTLDAVGAGISNQWFAVFENIGAGLVTLTPATGTINGEASITLEQYQGAYVFYDGTNFWALTSIPGSGGTISEITSATLTVTDPTGPTTDIELPATGVTAGSYTNANITVDAEGRLTAASNGSGGTSYIKGSVSIGPEGGPGEYSASGTVTGAVVGSVVLVGFSDSSEATTFTQVAGWVATTDTVTIQVTAVNSFFLTALPVVVFN